MDGHIIMNFNSISLTKIVFERPIQCVDLCDYIYIWKKKIEKTCLDHLTIG
jgi:hypothetical protein